MPNDCHWKATPVVEGKVLQNLGGLAGLVGMLSFKWGTNSGLLGENCVCDLPLNSGLHWGGNSSF